MQRRASLFAWASTRPLRLSCPLAQHTSYSAQTHLNAANIQMLSKPLHDQIFNSASGVKTSAETVKRIQEHLKAFGLSDKDTAILPDINFSLPELSGANIDEHFRTLALNQTEKIRDQAESIVRMKKVPPRPKKWVYREGWTKYDAKKRLQSRVAHPDDDALIFDIELMVTEGNCPTMATAVSPHAWYSWCSPRLVDEQFHEQQMRSSEGWQKGHEPENLRPSDLIPLGSNSEKLIVGHNVGFDRAFVAEQYDINVSLSRERIAADFSLRIAVAVSSIRCLCTSRSPASRPYSAFSISLTKAEVAGRRSSSMKNSSAISNVKDWIDDTSLNSLNAVYRFYFPHRDPLDKSSRDTFVKGRMQEVRENFQELMGYCASDVAATTDVFKALWPQFLERFPHPVTLAGMLEMGSTFLPVNADWFKYINSAETKYAELQKEQQKMLMTAAEDALNFAVDQNYRNDVWLWDLDWSVKKVRTKVADFRPLTNRQGEEAKAPYLPDAPQWYRDLCPREIEVARGHQAGPSKISTLMRVTPKLLRLVWDGFPVHYSDKHGWGYLVPKAPHERELEMSLWEQEEEGEEKKSSKKLTAKDFPLEKRERKESLVAEGQRGRYSHSVNSRVRYFSLQTSSPREFKRKEEVFDDVVPGASFYKLPHKDGKGKRVGNPLAKAFLAKLEDGCLRCLYGPQAEAILHHSNICSYWKMNKERIKGQMVVDVTPEHSHSLEGAHAFQGVILPKVVTAGTVTRRAVEATWLTASNAYADRIGSELKAMIRSPPGFHFVGADVDSQELWIASVLGDAYFAGVHGSTALGWMMLQGNKKDATDMHSMTASLVGISRDQAKVFNYGRIYGAGVKFAKQLLMQFNHRLTEEEAAAKARLMYARTKGRKERSLGQRSLCLGHACRCRFRRADSDDSDYKEALWSGGSESHMFNQLESIAQSDVPRTPVLGCTISKALEPRNVDSDFMASRINWVVQSSAVDYLHLMLVCMRWLLDRYAIDARFSISIHDEVRYLVRSEDKYRAALALQITNLLTRSMFAHQLKFNDLPLSVAFFSAVDLDVCLRKEVGMDCVTPSNPEGLRVGYGIEHGQALNIQEILEKTAASLDKDQQSSLSPSHQ
ncbi:hypothetical protein CAPTEDRAFT_18002 [Capitella teleta]|uniref:DNA polymerase subunit gamma-1 n=1 Tax=Capitella teleta TaxID=283909 RepID=R7TZN6_CAPTE|nr:hypothetical protein CAPTEDRAFT_18002 [Capitella teleta]|eukprot:ELT96390.1 hypothetical protein CAPTEDRAFT_18002 [Capitella teleta]